MQKASARTAAWPESFSRINVGSIADGREWRKLANCTGSTNVLRSRRLTRQLQVPDGLTARMTTRQPRATERRANMYSACSPLQLARLFDKRFERLRVIRMPTRQGRPVFYDIPYR